MLVHTIDAEVTGLVSATPRWFSPDRMVGLASAWLGFWLLTGLTLFNNAHPHQLWGPILGSGLAVWLVGAIEALASRGSRREHLKRLQRVVRLASGVLDTARVTFDPNPELRLLLELAVERGLEALQRAGVR